MRDPIGRQIGYWTRSVPATRRLLDPDGTSTSSGPLPLRAAVIKVNISGTRRTSVSSEGGRRPVCGTRPFSAYNTTVRLRGGLIHYLNDTFHGMSGSPVWVRRHRSMGGRVLVAVHIAKDDPNIPGKANRGVKITPEVMKFIIANLR